MKESKDAEFIIGIGLGDREQKNIKESFDSNLNFVNIQKKEGFSEEKTANANPLMAIIPWRVWKNLPKQNSKGNKQGKKKFVIIESEDQISDLPDSEFIAQCFIAVINSENTHADINKVMEQTESYKEFNKKFNKMSKEIELEREILSRKNSQLKFLNTLLSHAQKYLQIDRILSQIKEDIHSLIQVDHCQAIFWPTEEFNTNKTNIYLSANISKQQESKWINFLLNQKRHSNSTGTKNDYQTTYFKDESTDPASFNYDHILTFPLHVQEHTFGILAIQTPDANSLGKDKNEILNLGINHLAQVCYNAMQFAVIKEQAKYDGLTGLNNRQHFDEKLKEEFNRHQRHGQKLALLMLDIDHFKQLNDQYGHQAGDFILQELSYIVTNNVRESDFPARYGGEEFAIILPQTGCEQARNLAERIRKKIENTPFYYQGFSLNITVSLGITSFRPQIQNNHFYLVYLADQALYAGKNKGRNITSTLDPEKIYVSAKQQKSPKKQMLQSLPQKRNNLGSIIS